MEKKRTIKIYIQGRKSPVTIRGKESNISNLLADYGHHIEEKVDGIIAGYHYMIRISSITHMKIN